MNVSEVPFGGSGVTNINEVPLAAAVDRIEEAADLGHPMVASKQGEGTMNRIAPAGVLLILAVPAAAGPDALGCFTRTYDRAHLAQHPDQVVTAVKLRIYRPPPEMQISTGSSRSSLCAGKRRSCARAEYVTRRHRACAAWSSATAAVWMWSLVPVTPRCILIASAGPPAMRTPDGS